MRFESLLALLEPQCMEDKSRTQRQSFHAILIQEPLRSLKSCIVLHLKHVLFCNVQVFTSILVRPREREVPLLLPQSVWPILLRRWLHGIRVNGYLFNRPIIWLHIFKLGHKLTQFLYSVLPERCNLSDIFRRDIVHPQSVLSPEGECSRRKHKAHVSRTINHF
jgi:hypothetical protein